MERHGLYTYINVSLLFFYRWNSKSFIGPKNSHTSTRHLLWADENNVDISSGNVVVEHIRL